MITTRPDPKYPGILSVRRNGKHIGCISWRQELASFSFASDVNPSLAMAEMAQVLAAYCEAREGK